MQQAVTLCFFLKFRDSLKLIKHRQTRFRFFLRTFEPVEQLHHLLHEVISELDLAVFPLLLDYHDALLQRVEHLLKASKLILAEVPGQTFLQVLAVDVNDKDYRIDGGKDEDDVLDHILHTLLSCRRVHNVWHVEKRDNEDR